MMNRIQPERVMNMRPDYAPAHLVLAEILDADGKSADAMSQYQRPVDLTPPTPAQPAEFQSALARIHVLSTHQSQ